MLERLKNTGFCLAKINEVLDHYGGKKLIESGDYYTIIWSNNSTLEGHIDSDPYKMELNSLMFIEPTKTFSINFSDSEIYFFIFTADFFERSSFDTALLNSKIFYDTEAHIVPLSISSEFLNTLCVKRLSASFEDQGIYLSIARNIIEAIILEGIRLSKYTSSKEHHITENVLYHRFLSLLQKHYKTEKKVTFYSNLLNTTPRSLNKAIYAVAHKHAKDIIIDKIVRESRKQLKYTDEAVYSISWDLGFHDEANFSAFFKKHTGISPIEYRIHNKVLEF